jgi:hypothetical protein
MAERVVLTSVRHPLRCRSLPFHDGRWSAALLIRGCNTDFGSFVTDKGIPR